jgi:hypothetical protein
MFKQDLQPSSQLRNLQAFALRLLMSGSGLSQEAVLTIAGAFGGTMEAMAVQPFDMVKTRHQLNHQHNETVLMSLQSLYREGGFLRFYRGMAAELIGFVDLDYFGAII